MMRVFLHAAGLPLQRLRNPVARMRTRQMLALTFNLPLVGWWAVFLGTIAFGCLLNVYKTYRIAETRLQLARIEEQYTQQQQINTELLYRIGEEVDLNQVYIWAIRQGFIPRQQTVWLNPEPGLVVSAAAVPSGDWGDGLPSPDERIQTVSKHVEILGLGVREQLMEMAQQLGSFSIMPPDILDPPLSVPREDEARTWWQRLLDSANAGNP